MPETAEELCQRSDVCKEFVRASRQKPAAEVKAKTTDKFWFVTHALIIVGWAVLYFFLSAKLLWNAAPATTQNTASASATGRTR